MPSISGHEPEAEEKAKKKKKRQKRGNSKLNFSEAEKGPCQFQLLKPSKNWGGEYRKAQTGLLHYSIFFIYMNK